MSGGAILMSIRPQYVDRMISGDKSVELRRRRPKHMGNGTIVLIYASRPVGLIMGAFKVDHLVEKPKEQLWREVRKKAGVTREEFERYFSGVANGVGIFFSSFRRLPEPIRPESSGSNGIQIHPPQSYRYVQLDDFNLKSYAIFGDAPLI
ncbi:MAG: ASCH domain-containing protein [Candidatus Marinimicrobia bacterium]|nr:ASCH domain-containing protein [Candidatus Neomarinimicrobiota bacterium]